MASFTIDAPNGKSYTIEGENAQGALEALKKHLGGDAGASSAAPDDHGLARRQGMTAAERLVSPITEYPRNYAEMNQEARDQMSRGVGQIAHPDSLIDPKAHGISDVLTGAANVALGGLGYVASPISAAYRSLIGQPIEDLTGIPREYPEFAAQLATPGIGFTRMPAKPGVAPPISPADLRRVIITKDELPGGTGPSGAETAQAMQRLREAGIDVDAPRAITTDNTSVQRAGQSLSNTPVVGDPIARAVHEKLPAQIQQARDALAAQRGSATEANAADRAGTFLSDAATSEAAAQQKALDEANATISGHEAASRGAVEARTGAVNPQDTGAQAIAALREAERVAKQDVGAKYTIAGETPGVIKSDAVGGLHDRIKADLADANVNTDYPGTTGTAINMLNEVKKFEGGLFPGAPLVKAEIPAAPKVVGAVAAEAPKTQSLTEFLASKGGLGPDAELGAIGADRHVVDVGGVGKRRLVKQGGSTLDYAREAAEEAGYLPKGATPNDLLDALDAEMRGNKLYPQGLEGTQTSREAAAAAERARAEQSAFRRGLENDLKDAGHGELGPQVKARTLKIMEDERIGPDDAVEKAIRQLDHEDARKAPLAGFPGDLPMGKGSGVTLGGIERFRQNLRSVASGAERGSADERAAKKIIDSFDNWQQDAMQKALLSGDPKALEKFKAAREANRDWRERFGYNERDDVNNVVQKILHKDVTDQEVANWLVGSGKVGKQGITSRLYDGLMKATGNNPELAQSIQGAIWDTLSNSKNAAADIREFVHKSGRDLAEKVFPQGSRELMLRHADTLDKAKVAREMVGEAAKNAKSPMQELAKRIIGGKVDKPEALWKTIEGYTKEGGDVRALAGLVRELPTDMRGDIAGAVVRGLGKDRSGNFSLDIFASDWGKVTPQAKAVLFGNAGAHVKALDDLATIAQRLKNVKKQYGNPSGTGQTTAFQHLGAVIAAAAGGSFAPGTTAMAVGTGVGGNIAARVLASPASASSIAKYAKALEVSAKSPTPANQALVSMTERNLINTVKTLGASRALPPGSMGGMRQLQGTVPAGAENEQRQPVGVR